MFNRRVFVGSGGSVDVGGLTRFGGGFGILWHSVADWRGLTGLGGHKHIARDSRGDWRTFAESWPTWAGLVAFMSFAMQYTDTFQAHVCIAHARHACTLRTHCLCHACPFSCRWQDAVQSAAMELHFQRGPNYAKPSLLAHCSYIRNMMHINITHG